MPQNCCTPKELLAEYNSLHERRGRVSEILRDSAAGPTNTDTRQATALLTRPAQHHRTISMEVESAKDAIGSSPQV